MPGRGTLFLNDASGPILAPRLSVAVAGAARDLGLDVVELSKGLDVRALVRERIGMGIRLFVAAGGDGTIHHVIQGIVNTDAVLGVVPLGTYNHFARDLGIPLDWSQALSVAMSGVLRQIDTGRVNDRFFVNNVSFGLYPELVARREARGRDYPRWKARLLALYATGRKYRHVTVVVESDHHRQSLRTHVFIVSNNSYDLERIGIDAARPTLSEGKLSVYWLPHSTRWQLMKFAGHYLAGRMRRAPGFRSFRTVRMRVQSSRALLHAGIDGEVFLLEPPLAITIVPQSLMVRVPGGAAL